MQFVTSSNWKFDKKIHAKRVRGKSLTVPDEATSVADLLEQIMRTQQLPVAAAFGSYGEPDFDGPDLEKLRDSDMIDRDEFQLNLGSQMEGYREKMKVIDEEARKLNEKRRQEEESIRKFYLEQTQKDALSKEEGEKPKGVSQ